MITEGRGLIFSGNFLLQSLRLTNTGRTAVNSVRQFLVALLTHVGDVNLGFLGLDLILSYERRLTEQVIAQVRNDALFNDFGPQFFIE